MVKQEDLIERCRRGDPAAYTALYNQYSYEVYNTILRLVSHTAEAEDLLQESFVAAFEGIKGFKNTGGFRAWIKRIAINKSIDRIRKKKLRFVELENERMLSLEDEENIDEAAFAYTIEAVNGAIEALPDGYRTVFNLYVVEGIPQAEIAEMLGLENTAVRTQYHRAKHKILTMLREGGYDEKQTGRIYPQ
jgi:RNA polymerase sigma-70 factor (ECF subfamily)